jgi:hypothetical protein
MATIVLTSKQVQDIIAQEQEGAPPPVDPGLPSTRPPTFVPPPAAADVTYAFESLWQLPFLQHGKAFPAVIPELDNNNLWEVRIIDASTYEVFGATKWNTFGKLRLGLLSDEKARWNRPGYEDITAKLNALTIPDNSLMWFPDRMRYETLYDQAWASGDYILEILDKRGQVCNVNFTQTAQLPVNVNFYVGQAGWTRQIYCHYNL